MAISVAKLPQLIAEGRLPVRSAAVGIERPDLYAGAAARGLNAFGNALEATGLTVAAVEKNARDVRDVISGTADAAEELDRYRVELDSDPDYKSRETKFRQRAEAVKARLGEKMSNAGALDFEKSFERSYSVMAHSLRDRARKDEIEEHAVKLDESNNKILDIALREPDPRKRALHLEQIAANIEQARGANILSKSQADRYHTATLEKFERLQIAELQRTNPGAALRLLTAAGDKGGLKYMDPLAKRELALRVQRDMEHRAALASAATRATVGEVVSLLDNGVKPEKLDEARRLAKGNKKLTDDLDAAEGNYHATLQYRALDFTERRQATSAILEKEATTGLTATETRLLTRYAAAERQISGAYAEDPMATAHVRNPVASRALIAAQAVLDNPNAPADAAAMARGQFQTALDELTRTQVQDGGVARDAVRLTTNAAAGDLSQRLLAASPTDQVSLLDSYARRYGPAWPAMARELKLDDKKAGSPERERVASLGLVTASDPGLARAIAEGRMARQANKNYAPGDDKSFRAELDDRLGPSFKMMPGARELYVQEIADLYAKLAKDQGDTSGTLDTSRLKTAMRQRFGGDLVTVGGMWRGVKALPPAPGVDQSGFDTWLKTLTAEDLGLGAPVAGAPGKGTALPILPSSGRAVTAEIIGRNGFLFAIGEGRYRVEIDGELLADPRTGRPFTLDYFEWKRRMDALDARRGSYRR